MIGGIVGGIAGGSHVFDSIQTDVPALQLQSTLYAPTTQTGASTFIPTLGFTTTLYAPTTAFTISTEVPTLSFQSALYAPDTELILSTEIPTLSFASQFFAPDTELILSVDVPTLELASILNAPTTAGGASTGVPTVDLSLSLYSPETNIVIRGVPRFYVNVSGSTATLTFTNREEKEIQIFRAAAHNKEPEAHDFVSADTYNDSVDTNANDYGYRARFVGRVGGTIIASGQKSIKKITT
ncbi:hypothetical protein [Gracilimonas sp.]|uniref:hypothetical protein n=1 Tax=Gracilimonas sp. TaxID=1974203 RepID=UPI0028711B7D|nr:hypothetical protein [Gracilimonas sp.]